MKRYNQISTPVFQALQQYVNNETVAFHVPGHKRGQGMHNNFKSFVGSNVLAMDVTVFKNVDSFHNPKSVIKEAQTLAAKAYGADHTHFCLHGTSGAIQAMVMSVVGVGDKLIVPRNVHKSVSAGIILSGCSPVYMKPEICEKLGIAMNVTPESVENALLENPDAKAVLIINPTYYGVVSDIEKIAEIVHSYQIPLIVDEAHGPHLIFNEDLPISAMEAGADICCQSTHKLIGAMTQGSMLHIQGDLVDSKRVKSILNMLHTTSPSYVIMASLDVARMQMVTEGEQLLDQTLQLARDARVALNDIPGIYCFGKELLDGEGAYGFDETKLTISCRGLGISGYQLETILALSYNIQVELSDLYNVLAIVSIGDTNESLEKLIFAMVDISREYGLVDYMSNTLTIPQVPPSVLLPRDAFFSPSRQVEFDKSAGLISAELLMAYPPGIPILCQGEIITEEIIQYVRMLKLSGLDVQGTEDIDVIFIKVVDPIVALTEVTTA